MDRSDFIKQTTILGAGLLFNKIVIYKLSNGLLNVYNESDKIVNNFKSIESAIIEFKNAVKDKKLGMLFEYCTKFPLDHTIHFQLYQNKPLTYVVDLETNTMTLSDSTLQIWPYLNYAKTDKDLQQLILGVINIQKQMVQDSNIFKFSSIVKNENTNDTKEEVHISEVKDNSYTWETDSMCFFIRLSYGYWKATGDSSLFEVKWKDSLNKIINAFIETQYKDLNVSIQIASVKLDTLQSYTFKDPEYPIKPVGLIGSICRPSGDCAIYPYLVPSNLFVIASLRQASEIAEEVYKDNALSNKLKNLSHDVEKALKKYGTVKHKKYGKIYKYELNGSGSYVLMDDAFVPSLLSLPYLNAIHKSDAIYTNTRKMILSSKNPFYFSDTASKGIGSPKTGDDFINPVSIVIQGLTSKNDSEIKSCIQVLQKKLEKSTDIRSLTQEAKKNINITSEVFPMYSELLWKTYKERPSLLT